MVTTYPFCLLVITLISVDFSCGGFHSVGVACDESDASETSLNTSLFLGTWYTSAYLPSPDNTVLKDVVQFHFSSIENNTDELNLTLLKGLPDGKCETVVSGLYTQEKSGVFLIKTDMTDTAQFTNLLVLKMDYSSYAITLIFTAGCRATGSSVWIWGRWSDPPKLPTFDRTNNRCLWEISRALQNMYLEKNKDCTEDLSGIFEHGPGILKGEGDKPSAEEGGSNWKLFGVVSIVVISVVVIFGGAFLVDKYWKTGYLTLS